MTPRRLLLIALGAITTLALLTADTRDTEPNPANTHGSQNVR